jgi:hypothetical protein
MLTSRLKARFFSDGPALAARSLASVTDNERDREMEGIWLARDGLVVISRSRVYGAGEGCSDKELPSDTG